MRGFFALNFKTQRFQVAGTLGPAVQKLALVPVGHEILPKLADPFLPMLLMECQEVLPLGCGQGGTLDAVSKIPQLALFKSDLLP